VRRKGTVSEQFVHPWLRGTATWQADVLPVAVCAWERGPPVGQIIPSSFISAN
jgi:hypothetical protein